jgi:hypothetical protein
MALLLLLPLLLTRSFQSAPVVNQHPEVCLSLSPRQIKPVLQDPLYRVLKERLAREEKGRHLLGDAHPSRRS